MKQIINNKNINEKTLNHYKQNTGESAIRNHRCSHCLAMLPVRFSYCTPDVPDANLRCADSSLKVLIYTKTCFFSFSDKSLATCVEGQCRGHNERLNVWRAGQHFVRQLLPLRAPSALEPQIQLLLEAYSDTSWGVSRILTATEQLLHTSESTSSLGKFWKQITIVKTFLEIPNTFSKQQFNGFYYGKSQKEKSAKISLVALK